MVPFGARFRQELHTLGPSGENDGHISDRISNDKNGCTLSSLSGPKHEDSYTLWTHSEKMRRPILTGLVMATTVPHFGPILDPNMTTVTQFACPIFAIF